MNTHSAQGLEVLGTRCELRKRLRQWGTVGWALRPPVLLGRGFRGAPARGVEISVRSARRIICFLKTPWFKLYRGIAPVCGEGALLSLGLDAIGESALGMPAGRKGGWSEEYLLFRV